MTIHELAQRYAEKPTISRYEVLRDAIFEKEAFYPKNDNSVLEDIKSEIQKLRNCSCSNSDGIIDDIEDIIDKHISGKE